MVLYGGVLEPPVRVHPTHEGHPHGHVGLVPLPAGGDAERLRGGAGGGGGAGGLEVHGRAARVGDGALAAVHADGGHLGDGRLDAGDADAGVVAAGAGWWGREGWGGHEGPEGGTLGGG